jgi:hypothetical protein
MQEIDPGDTFCVSNVHLPARPSNVMGRLKSMSHTIQKMARLDPRVRKSPLDGLCVVAGDFNCDQNSVTAKLLTTGYSPHPQGSKLQGQCFESICLHDEA